LLYLYLYLISLLRFRALIEEIKRLKNKKIFFMDQDNKSEIPRLLTRYPNIAVHINNYALAF
jgi:hypothetical protein